jgi:hypothetical protein
MNAADHLRPEIQFGYRNQHLTPEELRLADAHLAGCAACRDTLARDMDVNGMAASVRAELESEPRQGRFPMATFAIAAAFFVVAAAAIWFSLHRAAQIDVASLHDRETAKEVEMTGDILEAGHLPLPDYVKDLTPPRQVLAGTPAGGPGLEIVSPVATGVMSGRPTFRWKRLEGDWVYQVRVFRPGSDLAAESGKISGAEWTCATELPSGITYQWQILAQRGSERVTFPQPPQAPPRFRVIDEATAARLGQLAENRGGVHLLLAIEYGKAGLIEDARRELQAELKGSRHAEAVERLIRSLDAN